MKDEKKKKKGYAAPKLRVEILRHRTKLLNDSGGADPNPWSHPLQ